MRRNVIEIYVLILKVFYNTYLLEIFLKSWSTRVPRSPHFSDSWCYWHSRSENSPWHRRPVRPDAWQRGQGHSQHTPQSPAARGKPGNPREGDPVSRHKIIYYPIKHTLSSSPDGVFRSPLSPWCHFWLTWTFHCIFDFQKNSQLKYIFLLSSPCPVWYPSPKSKIQSPEERDWDWGWHYNPTCHF